MIETLMRVGEIAQILSVSKSFAYQRVRQGEIPSIRLGKAVRVRPQDLDSYVLCNVSIGGHRIGSDDSLLTEDDTKQETLINRG